MKFSIGTVSNFKQYENDLHLIKSSLLYADEIELIGMVEYAIFRYLPGILDSKKDLEQLLDGLLPFLQSVNLPNKQELIDKLISLQDRLPSISPVLRKTKNRTNLEIKLQFRIKQLRAELQTQLNEALNQITADPVSQELKSMVEKGIVSVFDYKMQGMDNETMTGCYFGGMMNAIYAANTYPLFDETSIGLIGTIAKSQLININKLDGEVLRHAGIATNILMTLPTLESATYDELIDFKKQNTVPLARFRKAVYNFSEKISSLPWDDSFQYECVKLYDMEVAPQIAELNELFTQTSTIKNFGKKVFADEELRKKAGYVIGGLATAITTSQTLSGLFQQLLMTMAFATLSKEAASAFMNTVNLWIQAHDEIKNTRHQGSENVMYYYYLASKSL